MRLAKLDWKEPLNVLTVLLESIRHQINAKVVPGEPTKMRLVNLLAQRVHQGTFSCPEGQPRALHVPMAVLLVRMDRPSVPLVVQARFMGRLVDPLANAIRAHQGHFRQRWAPHSVTIVQFRLTQPQVGPQPVLHALRDLIAALLLEVPLNALLALLVPLAVQANLNAAIAQPASMKKTMFATCARQGGAK